MPFLSYVIIIIGGSILFGIPISIILLIMDIARYNK